MDAHSIKFDRVVFCAWCVPALAVLARVAAAFVPGMALFGVNELRFLPNSAWAFVVAAALPCVPALARRALPALRVPGDRVVERPWLASLALGGLLAALVVALPDRTAFVGDFLLREGSVAESTGTRTLFPQALPLDTFLHYGLAAWAASYHLLDANGAARALGALEAFALGALAVEFARASRARGTTACLVAGAVAFTGALRLCTGYSKAFSEMCLLTLAVAAFGVRVARDGERIGALGLALGLGFALHRSVLALLPAAALALALAWRDPALRPRFRRPFALLGLAAMVIAAALFLPQIARTATGFDMGQHFASAEVKSHGGLLAAAFAPARLLDLVNVLFALTPLLPLLLLAGGDFAAWRGREGLVLALLAASLLGLAFVLFPAQGTFRDWDVFAATAVARAALAAWMLGRLIEGGKRRAWLAVPTLAACVLGVVLGLWIAHDKDRGVARVEAFLAGPPARSEAERSKTWDYLGATWMQEGRDTSAARAFEMATQSSRNPRLYLQWVLAETSAGNLPEAQRVLKELVAFAPQVGYGWTLLGSVSWRLHDYPEAGRAAHAIAALKPDDAELQRSSAAIEAFVSAWEDSVRAANGGATPAAR